MGNLHYKIVPHDGGWAYTLNGAFSEAFRTREAALQAAQLVAQEQRVPGENSYIEYQTEDGVWHTELALGSDRPDADVEDA
jgi:hypothetical protein